MISEHESPRAVALFSGGLDSVLAVQLLLDQGIEVVGVHFEGGYCPIQREGENPAGLTAVQLGIELVKLPIDQDFIELIKAPKHGLGRNMNPCIDCHILMVKRAWEWGREQGAGFVITGEVLGQRPMSQNKQGLMLVAKRSGTGGRLLRPLSARLLEPTVPETTGLVDRTKLLDVQGRTRRRQLELAKGYGITDFATPAGGCLLTDAGFARRLREAFDHGEDSVATVELLRLGRHFRLGSGARLVVGRNRIENEDLLRRAPADSLILDAGHLPGPVGLLISGRPDDAEPAAGICARYSDRRGDSEVTLIVGGAEMAVKPASPAEAARFVIG